MRILAEVHVIILVMALGSVGCDSEGVSHSYDGEWYCEVAWPYSGHIDMTVDGDWVVVEIEHAGSCVVEGSMDGAEFSFSERVWELGATCAASGTFEAADKAILTNWQWAGTSSTAVCVKKAEVR